MTLKITAADAALQSRARLAGYLPERLEATVLIVGMGALGQNTALNLALSGVRELRVVDADRFETHNRTRSPLFPRDGAGVAKAPTTARALASAVTNPHAVVRYADAWIEDLGRGVFRGVDVVVSCVDTKSARAYLANNCRLLGVPLVEGGFDGSEVSAAVYPAASNASEASLLPCWCCGKVIDTNTVSCRLRAARAEAARVVPAIQNAAATLGGMQAEAVIETLHGHATEPYRLWFDVRSGEAARTAPAASPECTGDHRLLGVAEDSGIGPETPVSALIACAARQEDDPVLVLPAPFLDAAVCAGCERPMVVRAPGHRYRAAPLCTGCGGPWPQGEGDLNPVSRIRVADSLAQATGAALGLREGDLVEVGRRVLRLTGGPEDLFSTVAL